jgi:hypothetical protein
LVCPRLRTGQIVVMDNLSVHRGKWVRDLVEEKGCQLWLLPSHSPDLKCDEKAEAGGSVRTLRWCDERTESAEGGP